MLEMLMCTTKTFQEEKNPEVVEIGQIYFYIVVHVERRISDAESNIFSYI